jgi:hypothetical protein
MGKHKGRPHTLAFSVSGDTHMDAWQARIEAMLAEVSGKIDALLAALAEDDDPDQLDLDGFESGSGRDADQPL